MTGSNKTRGQGGMVRSNPRRGFRQFAAVWPLLAHQPAMPLTATRLLLGAHGLINTVRSKLAYTRA